MLSGFIFLDINKKQERSLSNSGFKNKKKAGKYTCACAPLAWKYTNAIFESKDGTISMKIVNQIERHNFCLNDLLTKSNHTEIQTYKEEERTFGTPCILWVKVEGYCRCFVHVQCTSDDAIHSNMLIHFQVVHSKSFSASIHFFIFLFVSLVMFV